MTLKLMDTRIKKHKIKNEYDILEFIKIINSHNVFITADYPRCGKSQVFKDYIVKTGKKGLLITKFTVLGYEIENKLTDYKK